MHVLRCELVKLNVDGDKRVSVEKKKGFLSSELPKIILSKTIIVVI